MRNAISLATSTASYSRSLYLVSPPVLIATIWAITLIAAELGYLFRDSLPIVAFAMRENGISYEASFPAMGMAWLAICLTVYLVITTYLLPNRLENAAAPSSSFQLNRMVAAMSIIFVIIFVIILLWIVSSIALMGGLAGLIQRVAESNTYEAREMMVGNKLFMGMRLLYASLSCFGVLSACVLAHNFRTGHIQHSAVIVASVVLALTTILLMILPIILSQRIILIHMILSAGIASCIVSGRTISFKYLPVIMGVLLTTWSLREIFTASNWNPDVGPLQLSMEKLLFYFVNDLANSVKPFTIDPPMTYGLFTFRFLVFFSTMPELFAEMAAEALRELEQFRGGGEFPMFTAPFIDFSFGGILIVVFLALLSAYLFKRAQNSFLAAAVYGQFAGTLLISPHVGYYSSHNFIVNIVLTIIICQFILRNKSTRAEAAALQP